MGRAHRHKIGLTLLLALVAVSSVLAERPDADVRQPQVTRPASLSGGSLADSVINLKQWKIADGGNDHWYGILAVLHDWREADSIAPTLLLDTMTGYLATIRDSAENAFVFDSVLAGVDPPSLGKLFFLGARATSSISTWAWSTGETFCYTKWADGEPNFSWETALAIYGPTAAPQNSGYWNNIPAEYSDHNFLPYWSIVEWGPPNFTPVSFCANGIVECGEECDDGNNLDNDGCNSSCLLEVCGDGIQQPWEECDDGNTIAGDGCDPNCLIEACGNGRVDFGECCDDSNTVDGDGCSAACLDESAVCGNGILECPEVCDDGNLVSGDGCSPSCERQCLPGDLNSSTTVTSNDIICLVNYVFLRLRGICDMWPCQFVGDVNCNGTVTSADIIYLVNYIFKSGAPPCNSCAECGL